MPCRQCGVNEIKIANCTVNENTKCKTGGVYFNTVFWFINPLSRWNFAVVSNEYLRCSWLMILMVDNDDDDHDDDCWWLIVMVMIRMMIVDDDNDDNGDDC